MNGTSEGGNRPNGTSKSQVPGNGTIHDFTCPVCGETGNFNESEDQRIVVIRDLREFKYLGAWCPCGTIFDPETLKVHYLPPTAPPSDSEIAQYRAYCENQERGNDDRC